MMIRRLSLEERNAMLPKAFDAARSDEPAPRPEHSTVFGAFEEGRCIGTITAEKVWCVSGLWVDQKFRGSGVAEQLAAAAEGVNDEELTAMAITTNAHVERLVFGLGFRALLGTLWRR